MFTISFRDGSMGGQMSRTETVYHTEYLRNPYKNMNLQAEIGELFMDFISITGNLAKSNHPFVKAIDNAEDIGDNPWFFARLRKFMDMGIDIEAFFTIPCLLFFLELWGLRIPAIQYDFVRKQGHEDDCLEDRIDVPEDMDLFEHSMRAYLAAGSEIYDAPITVYHCETLEDACIASLHYLISNHYNIRKCKNCGRYFVAYLRSDAEYCTRISPYNSKKTCREDGPKRTHIAAVNGDAVKKRLKQIESARRMRIHRNPGDWDIQTEFDEWHTAMIRWRGGYQSGAITAEQFLAWLEDHKSYTEDWDYEENYPTP